MMNNRVKILVMCVFVLTLGAGVVLGAAVVRGKFGAIWNASRPVDGNPANPVTPMLVSDGSLGEQLSLTADQRDKMKPIWENVRNLSDASLAEALKFEHERDEKIKHLIPPAKMDEYKDASAAYDDAVAGLKGRRQKAFNDAVKKTKEILTPNQREKYDEILRKRLGADYDGGHDSAGASPVTQPSS